MRAAVEEAQAVGKYVLSHAYSDSAVRRAVEAGVRSIEHGNLIREAAAKAIKDAGAFLVPTMVTYEAIYREGKRYGIGDHQIAKIDLARKHAKRSRDLARFMAESLAAEAQRAGAGSPALAWELSQAAARLAPDLPEAFPADQLLAAPDLRRAPSEIRDHQARENALEAIRASRGDWADIYIEQISREEDARVLASLFDALGDRATELRRRILRSPRSAPRAFVWLLERMHAPAPPK